MLQIRRSLHCIRNHKIWILLFGILITVFVVKHHFVMCGCIQIRRILNGDTLAISGYPHKDLPTISNLKQRLDFNEACLAKNRQIENTPKVIFEEWQRKGVRKSNILPFDVCSKSFPQNKSSDFTINADEKLYYQHVFKDCPRSNQRVPNIVHYMWLYDKSVDFRFHHLLSALSALQILKPCHIVVWTQGFKPAGKWWDYLTAEVDKTETELRIEMITPPGCIMGKYVKMGEHRADWAKLLIMHEIGGIALDLDLLVLKPFDPLMCYDYAMGRQEPNGLNIGLMIGPPGSKFVRLWLDSYATFNPSEFDIHGVKVPFEIYCRYPDLVHVEGRTMHYPLFTDSHLKMLYGDKEYDWKKNYALHLWYRKYNVEHNAEDIKTLRSTFGSLARLIYYGAPEVIVT